MGTVKGEETLTRHDCQQRLNDYAARHFRSERRDQCRIELILSHPYGGTDRLHLDGVLSAAVVAVALPSVSLPPSVQPYDIPLPLTCCESFPGGRPLYQNSDGWTADELEQLPQGEARHSPSHLTASFTWVKRNDRFASLISRRKRDGQLWQPSSGSGPYKEYRVPLTVTATAYGDAWLFWAEGDGEQIERLLSLFLLTGIGKKRALGFGSVSMVRVIPDRLPGGSELGAWGIGGTDPAQRWLLRPLPVSMIEALGWHYDPATLQQIGYTPPYWLPANQTLCVPSGGLLERAASLSLSQESLPDEREPTLVIGGRVGHQEGPLRSVAHFLVWCERQHYARSPQGELVICHSACRALPAEDHEVCCAVTGVPLEGEGVPREAVIHLDMGNAVDFLQAPGSRWVAPEAASVLADARKWHRGLVALASPDWQEGWLFWPLIGGGMAEVQPNRPLWREVIEWLPTRYRGYWCVVICKDEPKTRQWPRARIGRVGQAMPVWLSDGVAGVQELRLMDADRLHKQLRLIEQWLDLGCSKLWLRTAGEVGAVPSSLSWSQVQEIVFECRRLRQTPEFAFSLLAARHADERR